MRFPLSTGLLSGVAVVCLGAVGAALVSQYGYDMQPCPYCVLQRAIFVAIAIASLLALPFSSPAGRRTGALVALLLAFSGIAAALWQHFVAAATASCNLTFADRVVSGLKLDSMLPDVFSARASCADAAVDLLGVPYEFWSLAVFAGVAVALLQVLRRPAD